METTLVIIKPDAVQRRLIGETIARFERRGLFLRAMKFTRLSRGLVERQYEVHRGKPFFEPLVNFMISGPVVLMAVSGQKAIAVVRSMLGATACADSAPGSLRGDLGLSNRFNLVHASDSLEAAERELALFFAPQELFDWTPDDYRWVIDRSTGTPV